MPPGKMHFIMLIRFLGFKKKTCQTFSLVAFIYDSIEICAKKMLSFVRKFFNIFFMPYFILFLFVISVAEARFATKDDSGYIIESEETKITVHADGAYDIESEQIVELVREDAREHFSKMIFTYHDKTEKFDVISAKTIFEGKEYPVEKSAVEDKPLVSSSNGFEDRRQVSIPFPKTEIGSKIYLKTKYSSNLIICKNHFFTTLHPVSNDAWQKAYHVQLSSKIPLHIQVNDPNGMLTIKTDAKNPKDTITCLDVSLKKEGTETIQNEFLSRRLSAKKKTWISLSSLTDYKDMLKDLIPEHEKVLKQPLPALHQEILNAALSEKTEEGQLKKVMVLLSEKVQYLGSWMTFKGLFIPRDLADVDKTRFGDCKDFSAAMVAIARQLGFKADVAFVQRGESSRESYGLPQWFTNHAIVRLENKDGKVYWLDPTNFSCTLTVRNDIHDRPVLVPVDVEKAQAACQHIPKIDPFIYTDTQTYTVLKDQNRIKKDIQIHLSETHQHAELLTGAYLKTGKKNVEDLVFMFLEGSPIQESDRISMTLPDLTSRIVQPLDFSASYYSADLLKSNLGKAILLKDTTELINGITKINEADECDWFASKLGTYEFKSIIKETKILHPERLNDCIDSPWFKIERTAEIQGADSIITTRIIVHQDLIKNEDLKTPEFKLIRKKINEDFQQIIVELDS
ncbi:MAG: hypothetical protein HEEMFOPI_00688 [Holosporales bacterium]